MMLDSRKVWKVTKLDFWKKNSSEKQKQPDKNLIHSYVFFYLNMKVLMILQLSVKKCVGKTGEKYDSWVVVQKPLDQSECKFL